jgi:hypothetical protein
MRKVQLSHFMDVSDEVKSPFGPPTWSLVKDVGEKP